MSVLRVHMLHEFDEEVLRDLRERLDSCVELTVGRELPDPADFEVLVAGRPERRHLAASPRLSAIVIPWAGVAAGLPQLLSEHPDVSVHNLHHNAQPTAETALALLLAVAKSLGPTDREMREHDWKARGRDHPSLLLAGRTALVLGSGAVGRRLGEMCRALSMDVIAVGREARLGVHGAGDLAGLLPRADALLICAPLTPETEGLIGAAEVSLLPRGAVVVNVGRGPIVDEAALHAALVSGHLHGAGLDVWWRYPQSGEDRTPPADHAFWDLQNVVLSPHKGGFCDASDRLRMQHLAELLNALGRGDRTAGRVDLSRGY